MTNADLAMTKRYGDPRDSMRDVCDPQVADKVKRLWVLTDEGELSGVWRDSGHESLWFGLGTLSSCICCQHSRSDDEKKATLGSRDTTVDIWRCVRQFLISRDGSF